MRVQLPIHIVYAFVKVDIESRCYLLRRDYSLAEPDGVC